MKRVFAIAAVVLLTGCIQTPVYRQTWDQARATSDPQQSRALCEKALQQAEAAGAVCKDDYYSIMTYLFQSPILTADERTELLQHSIDVLATAKCRDLDAVRFNRLNALSEHLYGLKEYEKADKPLTESLELAKKIWGADSKALAGVRDDDWKNSQFKAITYPSSLYDRVANCKEKLGKFAEAESMRRKQVELYTKYFADTGALPGTTDGQGLSAAKAALENNLVQQQKSTEK